MIHNTLVIRVMHILLEYLNILIFNVWPTTNNYEPSLFMNN
jgi:hypothetical protein